MFREFTLVQVHKSHHFATSFSKEYFMLVFLKLREFCGNQQSAALSNHLEIFLVKIRKLFLTQN